MQRLDKYLCHALSITRKQASKELKSGEIEVNGAVVKSGATKVSTEDEVTWQGRTVEASQTKYIMLHKPEGFVCSHEDSHNQTVYELLFDEFDPYKLHFAGRLDADTTGLVLMTDDGQWSHRITSPKHKCTKVYHVTLADPIEAHYEESFASGIELRNEKELTLPAKMEKIDDYHAVLSIHQGKYHQVKRMFAALGNKVIKLHRSHVGSLALDPELELGEYRYLTDEEIENIVSEN